MKTSQKTVLCRSCGRDVEYRTKRPLFCGACYRQRRLDRRAGIDTSPPLVPSGFQKGHIPWNLGLTIEDPRVAGYAAKLRLLERLPVQIDRLAADQEVAAGQARPMHVVGTRRQSGGRMRRCRLCRGDRNVTLHYLDLNPNHDARSNTIRLCDLCRSAVLLLVGRDRNVLTRLLTPEPGKASRRRSGARVKAA